MHENNICIIGTRSSLFKMFRNSTISINSMIYIETRNEGNLGIDLDLGPRRWYLECNI